MKPQYSIFLIQFTPSPSHKGQIVIQITFQMLSKLYHAHKVNTVRLITCISLFTSQTSREPLISFSLCLHIPLVEGPKNLCGSEIWHFPDKLRKVQILEKTMGEILTLDSCLTYHGKDWIVFHVFMSRDVGYCCSCALC